jgi:hypothetical protein
MEAGKEREDKEYQEFLWSFSSCSSPRIVVGNQRESKEIKEKIRSKFYQQAVTDPACNLKQNWRIYVVLCLTYEFHISGK